MSGSTLNHTVASSVTLNSAGYPSPLTITSTGAIDPATHGTVALVATLSPGYMLNQGAIIGGAGFGGVSDTGIPGGLAVDLGASTLVNDGTIAGGYGGAWTYGGPPVAYANTGGTGGTAVTVAGGSLTNRSMISGGSGGAGAGGSVPSAPGGAGGDGVDMTSGTASNDGIIVGGAGGTGGAGGGTASPGGIGGAAFDLQGGSLTNAGRLIGGAGGSGYQQGGAGGVAVTLAAGTLTNDGLIAGGGGASGEYTLGAGGTGVAQTGGSLFNAGVVAGGGGDDTPFGEAGGPGGAGGVGVALSGGSLTNIGTIFGGGGGFSSGGPGAAGGSGVVVTAGSATNSGLIEGGGGSFNYVYPVLAPGAGGAGGAGGSGVALGSGSLTNTGAVIGGAGGFADILRGEGGAGGVGVALTSGTLGNNGLIAGGVGAGGGFYGYGVTGGGTGTAGAGGTGVLAGTGLVSNTGAIEGGAGGGGGAGGPGGTGLDLTDGMVTNSGTIAGGNGANSPHFYPGGSGGTGISLEAGSSLLNMGLITGGAAGYEPGLYGDYYAVGGTGADVTNGTLTNHGTILGGASGNGGEGGAGVNLANGVLTNDGSIAGAYGRAGVSVGFGTLTNNGTIAGGSGSDHAGAGVAVVGGILSNSGAITGGSNYLYGGTGVDTIDSTLINDGTIAGGSSTGESSFSYGGTGVDITYGTLTNHGTITGGNGPDGSGGIAALFHGGGTLTDAGFIGGGNGGTADAVEFGSAASRLILDPGASCSGAVVADAAYSNVLELADPAGFGEVAGLGATIIGFGTIAFDPGADWLLSGNAAGLAAGQTIDGFQPGDTIELTGFVESGHSYTSAGLVLTGAGSSDTIGIQGAFTTADFDVFTTGGNSFVELVPCFAAGTRIATDQGEIAVEALAVGDQVRALLGDALASIIWIGHRTVDCAHHPKPTQVWPVRIRAGAFGRGRPRRDLFLSPDHAVYVNEVLIPVKHLLGGTSIVQVQVDAVTYYHLELHSHDVLLAEGLAVESYLDLGDRANFANGGGVVRQFPDFTALAWEACGCAPLTVTGPKLAAARRLVATIAQARDGAPRRAVA